MKSPRRTYLRGLLLLNQTLSICSLLHEAANLFCVHVRLLLPPSSRAGASLCRPWHYGGCTRHPGYRHHAPHGCNGPWNRVCGRDSWSRCPRFTGWTAAGTEKAKKTKEIRYDLLAQDTAAFIQELGLSRSARIGSSDGGVTGLLLAIGWPGASFLRSSMRVQYTSAQAEALVLLGIQAGRHEAGPADAAHGGPAVGHHTAAACVYLHARFGNGRANCQTKCNRN